MSRCQCQVINESQNGSFTQLCGESTTIYQAASLATAPTGTLSVQVSDTTCTVTVTVLDANGNSIERSITPSSLAVGVSLTMTLSRIASIAVACSGGLEKPARCTIRWNLAYHYCKCCRA